MKPKVGVVALVLLLSFGVGFGGGIFFLPSRRCLVYSARVTNLSNPKTDEKGYPSVNP